MRVFPEALRLSYEGLAVDVASADPALTAWLAEFLSPAFEVGVGDRRADHRIEIVADPAEHDRLHVGLETAQLGCLEGFTFDGRFSLHRGWVDAEGRLWAHDERYDAFYGVWGTAASRVRLVLRGPGEDARIATLRTVRELATTAQLRAGRLPLHAAAFLHRSRAMLVCGPKRAGKTTLLVHALRGGAEFLSNDRVLIAPGQEPIARAMPTIVMLRDGTLRHFAGLTAAFEDAAFDRARTLDECAPGVPRPAPRASQDFDRPGISPAQLCRLLGVPMRGAAPVGGILLPVVDPRVRGTVLEPLSSARAARALADNLLAGSRPTRASRVFAAGPRLEVDPQTEAKRCRLLAARVPAWTCRLGPDAYERDLRETLRDLPAMPPTDPGPPRGSAAP